MKYHFSFLLVALFSLQGIGQIITVSLTDAFEYEYTAKTYSINLTENLSTLYRRVNNESEREEKFNSDVNSAIKYLDEKSINYEKIEYDKDKPQNLPEGAIALNSITLKLRAEKKEVKAFENYLSNLDGLSAHNKDTFVSVDENFMKSCISRLTEKAKEKARPYAIGMNRKIGEVAELKILKHNVTKHKNDSFSAIRENKNSTHNAFFQVEFSFETVKE